MLVSQIDFVTYSSINLQYYNFTFHLVKERLIVKIRSKSFLIEALIQSRKNLVLNSTLQ